MIRSLSLLATVCACSLPASLASATVVLPLTVAELTRQSQVVVHGRVLDRVSLWDSARQKIYTHTRIGVLRGLKGGGADREILVRQLGGRVGSLAMGLSGNASLKVGEEVVLFLTRDSLYHYVVALAQGKFSVHLGEAGRKEVRRDLSGLAFVSRTPGGRMVIAKRWKLAAPLTLDELEAQVKAAQSR